MNDREYYKCYSFNLKRFIEAHGVYAVSQGVHPRTDKIYHIFILDDELSRILTAWSNNRDKALKLREEVG